MAEGNATQVDALLEEGLINYGLGKFMEAVAKWNRALEIDPDNAQAIEYLAIVQEDLDPDAVYNREMAAPEGETEGHMDPSGVDVTELLSRGIAFLENGNPENAYETFREAADSGTNMPEVYGYLEMARVARLEYYRRLIPDLDRKPRLVMDFDSMKGLKLGKEEGFIIGQIDGAVSFRDILALSRMEKLEAMSIISRLIFSGVIQAE